MWLVADGGRDASRRAPVYPSHTRLPAVTVPGAARDRAEQCPLQLTAQQPSRCPEICTQVRFERVMTRYRERLVAFFVQMHLQPVLLHIDVVDSHRERCADLREQKHHQRDQRAVT